MSCDAGRKQTLWFRERCMGLQDFTGMQWDCATLACRLDAANSLMAKR